MRTLADWMRRAAGARFVTTEPPVQGSGVRGDVFLADVRIDWDQPDDEATVILDKEIQVGAFPLPQPGRWRLVDPSDTIGTDDPAGRRALPSVLNSHGFPKAASATRAGSRPFESIAASSTDSALGPAWLRERGHIHSPAGGQGMNTGIQEACNLAWKLGLVHAGVARDPEGLWIPTMPSGDRLPWSPAGD